MDELELFLFGARSIYNDGTYRPTERKKNEIGNSELTIGYIEIDFETGKITTYDSKGNPDN